MATSGFQVCVWTGMIIFVCRLCTGNFEDQRAALQLFEEHERRFLPGVITCLTYVMHTQWLKG